MKREHLSVEQEPAHSAARFEADPAEDRVDPCPPPQAEIDRLRDSVRNEPWDDGAGPGPAFGEWLDRRRGQTTRAGNLGCLLPSFPECPTAPRPSPAVHRWPGERDGTIG